MVLASLVAAAADVDEDVKLRTRAMVSSICAEVDLVGGSPRSSNASEGLDGFDSCFLAVDLDLASCNSDEGGLVISY